MIPHAKDRDEGILSVCIASAAKYSRIDDLSTANPSPPREYGVGPTEQLMVNSNYPAPFN